MLEIAIVGIGCRFPGGATNPEEFWKFLVGKGDGMTEVPADRWSLEKFYDPDPDAPGRMYVRKGGFLAQSPWEFDPEYFGISPREAAIMDPQQRLLLEVAVEALDDAGMNGTVGGREVGVYIGGFTSDNQVGRHQPNSRSAINSHTATSGTFTMLSNRLSYVLDLHGPSMTIDTACSSSMVAIHEAAQAVARGECDVALAGGVNSMIAPETFISMCKGRFLAADGRCKTFDAAADGYARGEGSGVIVLKPLAVAQADGDRVYAVIRATGSNQDGRTSGITVPNPVAQAALARRVLAQSGLAASDIGYVEAHGTGTAIGDPLEIQALGQTYGNVEGRHTPLVVGSVKAAIGHTEAASGVAGVIKAALTLYHRTIAPQAWLQELNPAIPFAEHRIEIPTEVRPFPAGYPVMAAAANGFGYGGTNAHVVMVALDRDVSEPPATGDLTADDLATEVVNQPSVRVLPVSGRTDAAARAAAGALLAQLDSSQDPADSDSANLDAMTAAAWSRRLHHPMRTAFAFTDADDLRAGLSAFAAGEGRAASRVVAAEGDRPVFVFSGMGPQWWAMGRELLERDGAFRRTALEIDAVFIDIAGWSIVEALLADEDVSRVAHTEVAQPANFLVQVGLAAELKALGIEPAAILGHSVGEVSAAYLSGALSLHDALLVSCHRARLQATTAGTGGMLAVGLPEAEALTWSADGSVPPGSVSVAAVNSPSSVTLAGDSSVLADLADRLAAAGIFARPLRVEVPYHSHLMDPILGAIRITLATVAPHLSTVPLYSSVTAQRVTDAAWGADYWVDNVRQPVRFAAAIEALIADGHRVFLEVGPHAVLGGNIREILVRGGENGAVVATLSRSQPDLTSLGQAVAELYSAGVLANRPPGSPAGPVAHASLPTYPWQRIRVWSEVDASVEDRLGDPGLPPMLGRRTSSSTPEWETDLSVSALPWLHDHVVDGLVLLPGAGFVDAALSAAAQLGKQTGESLADLRFASPRIVEPHDVPVLRIGIEPSTNRFTIDSRRGTDMTWGANVSGRIVDGRFAPGSYDFSPPADATHVSGAELYPRLDARGLSYGPAFRGIVEAWVGTDRVFARVDASTTDHGGTGAVHLAHPATTDAALQCVAALIAQAPDAPAGAVVPYGIAAVRRHRPLGSDVVVSARRLDRPGLWTDIALADPDGTVALELLGVEFRPVRPEPSVTAQLKPLWYELVWERHGQPADTPFAVDHTDLLVVSLGLEPAAAARALMVAHTGARLLTVPSAVEDALAPDAALEITRLLRVHTGDRALTIAIVPSAPAGPNGAVAIDHELADRATGFAGGLLATAKAVQQALDERVLDGGARSSFDITAVVVTEQAFGVPGDVEQVKLDQAALIGIRRTLRNEQPTLNWRHVDVESTTPPQELVAEVFAAPAAVDGSSNESGPVEDEIALRGGVRLALSLQRNLTGYLDPLEVARPLTDPEASFRVEAPASMLLGDLALREAPRLAPGPEQVEVRVLSAGINYKDSAKVIGLLTERELAGTYFGTDLGMESIGVIVRVGPDVTRFAVGDRMSIGAKDSLSRYLTLDLDRGGVLSLAPTPWADTDAALNLPFLTAHHCLADVARVETGETVLIHGAAGGVGLAAIQVAKRLGAVVIGTAGNDERRAAVLGAGADHALDSRSLSFVEDVRGITRGRGVDVVLNSAPGEVIAANLQVAAEFGRIIEIGKADIYGGGIMALAPFDHNLSFIAVDIDRMVAFRRPAMVTLVETINDAFERGWYTPLPTTVYSVDRLSEAFEAVARGTHVGRVVVDFRDAAPLVKPARPTAQIHADATYVVTGGFGAFGLATARWLAASGARHLALVGRSGASTVSAKQAVVALEQSGVTAVEVAADVSHRADVDAMLDQLAATGYPVRGVFHAAGVLDDRAFTDIDAESLRRVMGPKVAGAINLHEATTARDVELDFFVTYSSATAITGTVPQSSYAAANTVLDSLVQLRRANGQPALTVNWGALSGGMADSSETVSAYLAAIGLQDLDMELAARLLEQALALDVTHIGILKIDWARWGATHPASAQTTRFLEHVSAAGNAGSDAARLHSELLALPEAQRIEVVAYMLAEQFAIVLGIPAESIDLDTAMSDLGMDSLMAVEMQARVNLALNVEMSALEFGQGGLSSLAARIMPSLLGSAPDPSEDAPLGAAV